ncbi:hypothetical protein PR048_010508 [Dryococelus australis]|uniref:Uncharacterized protein n=1 Tax=Dryococelus australis TaxID=614101 RepID=A0ABQ9I2W7_9NEOP|nr:hypothetical protein PR048_010508 [Dryococelus australis]
MWRRRNGGAGEARSPEKTRRPTASSGTIPTCENPVTRPGIEPGLPRWEASVLAAQPPITVTGHRCLPVHSQPPPPPLPRGILPSKAFTEFGQWPRTASPLASHQGDPGSIPSRATQNPRMWESCRTMPLAGGFSRRSPTSPPFIPAQLHTHLDDHHQLSSSRYLDALITLFQQDGCLVHLHLNNVFPRRWIGRVSQDDQHLMLWPPRSPDLFYTSMRQPGHRGYPIAYNSHLDKMFAPTAFRVANERQPVEWPIVFKEIGQIRDVDYSAAANEITNCSHLFIRQWSLIMLPKDSANFAGLYLLKKKKVWCYLELWWCGGKANHFPPQLIVFCSRRIQAQDFRVPLASGFSRGSPVFSPLPNFPSLKTSAVERRSKLPLTLWYLSLHSRRIRKNAAVGWRGGTFYVGVPIHRSTRISRKDFRACYISVPYGRMAVFSCLLATRPFPARVQAAQKYLTRPATPINPTPNHGAGTISASKLLSTNFMTNCK